MQAVAVAEAEAEAEAEEEIPPASVRAIQRAFDSDGVVVRVLECSASVTT